MPEQPRFMEDEQSRPFEGAIAGTMAALNANGLSGPQSCTCLANLLCLLIAGMCEEETAPEALEALIIDMRRMLPMHIAQLQRVQSEGRFDA